MCDPHDESTLRELLEKCKALAKKHRSYVLKMDPDIEVEDTQFEEIVKTWVQGEPRSEEL